MVSEERKKRNIKLEHYGMRDSLTLEKRREILEREFADRVGYFPDLEYPRSFNEKIMWLKLYYQDPLMCVCADKYAMKGHVDGLLGEGYTVPVLKVYQSPSEVDFSELPQRFVLKVNWCSGYNIIVDDKSSFDEDKVRRTLEIWSRPDRNCYWQYFNWAYRHVPLTIYAEQFITQTGEQLYDYKLYFSGGRFIYMFIATDRYSGKGLTYTFFDDLLKPMPFTYGRKPSLDPPPDIPEDFGEMLRLGGILAKDHPFVRVDFYRTDTGRIYVGEMTFYSGGGILPFDPPVWDMILGEKIILPRKLVTED
ncbi:MAG: glycosyl transferase [Eubacteriaceae bacterium]|nr:glycosyl transferase [Eubacteriaceae bacterium]